MNDHAEAEDFDNDILMTGVIWAALHVENAVGEVGLDLKRRNAIIVHPAFMKSAYRVTVERIKETP